MLIKGNILPKKGKNKKKIIIVSWLKPVATFMMLKGHLNSCNINIILKHLEETSMSRWHMREVRKTFEGFKFFIGNENKKDESKRDESKRDESKKR